MFAFNVQFGDNPLLFQSPNMPAPAISTSEPASSLITNGLSVDKTDYTIPFFGDIGTISPNTLPTSLQTTREKLTSPVPQSPEMQNAIAIRLADHMGELVAKNHQQLLPDAIALISQKMTMASNLAAQNDLTGQMRFLLSAFGDAEWFIGSLLSEFQGVEPPVDVKTTVATLRNIESMIIKQIKSATGIDFSEDELRALLEKDPKDSQENISLNFLIQRDHEMKPVKADAQGQVSENDKNSSMNDKLYGLRSNPAKLNKNLNSASKKMTQELDRIVNQVASLLHNTENKPGTEGLANLMAAVNLLQRGVCIAMLANGLKDFPNPNQEINASNSSQARLMQLSDLASSLQQKVGLEALSPINTPLK